MGFDMEKAGSKQGRDKKVTRGWQEGVRKVAGRRQEGGRKETESK